MAVTEVASKRRQRKLTLLVVLCSSTAVDMRANVPQSRAVKGVRGAVVRVMMTVKLHVGGGGGARGGDGEGGMGGDGGRGDGGCGEGGGGRGGDGGVGPGGSGGGGL